jgi:NADP-dependent 3-hydroxy acid dehydrogenase YdfG
MDKIVLITGCSTGIGRDLAQTLTQAGYTVVATARQVEALQGVDAALKLTLDVTRPDSIHEAVEQTIQRFGRIDVLVNNAGYAVRGAVEEVPVEQAQQMFDVNVFGVMRVVQAVVPHMRQQNSGRIINISSVVGKLVTPANGTYSAAKFAL